MQSSNCLAIATASLIVFMASPCQAQQRSSTQNVKSTATTLEKPKPSVRPVAPVVRDHTKTASGGVTVTPSARKRHKSSSCIKSALGGPCVGGFAGRFTTNVVTLAGAASGKKLIRDETKPKRKQTVDHRTK